MRPLGLTLLEVLGTLGILALVLALALPASGGLLIAYRAEGDAALVEGFLREARAEALRRSHPVAVALGEGRVVLCLDGDMDGTCDPASAPPGPREPLGRAGRYAPLLGLQRLGPARGRGEGGAPQGGAGGVPGLGRGCSRPRSMTCGASCAP